jgi:hypothetical protein
MLSEKQLKAKRIWDMVQVTEHLLIKCKALSSNLSTTQRKKKRERFVLAQNFGGFNPCPIGPVPFDTEVTHYNGSE